jgi:protein-S-isoprenylcysteine O-methyltransferase Ste14
MNAFLVELHNVRRHESTARRIARLEAPWRTAPARGSFRCAAKRIEQTNKLNTKPAHYKAADRPPAIANAAVILAIAIAIGIVLDRVYSIELLPRFISWIVAIICGVFAIGIGTAAVRLSRRSDAALLPAGLVTVLVIAGPYQYSRNPLLIAQALLLACVGLAMQSAMMLAMLVPWALIVHFAIVKPEERYLERKFGDVYLAYKHRVRRWL